MAKKFMKIGDVRQCNGRYMPDGTIQHINIGIMSLTGQNQALILDNGATVHGLSATSFIDGQEVVCPADLLPPAPNGTKPNPTPPGAHKIGQKISFAKAYLLDQKYGSPRNFDPSGQVINNFGTSIITGRQYIDVGGVRTQGYCHRKSLLEREYWSPIQ